MQKMLLGNKTKVFGYIKHAKKLRLVGTFSVFSFVLLSLLSIFPIVHHEDQAEAAYTRSTSTISIVANKNAASVEIAPASSNGTFAVSSAEDQAEFTVTTNNLTGYSLNILGTDTSGQLVNAGTGDVLDTIAANTTEEDFRNSSDSSYINKWGYRLNINNTTTTDFFSAPTTNTSKLLYATQAPNTTPDNYKLGLGAKANYEKSSGLYINTFVLSAVGNPITYQINYLDNTGTGGTTGSDVANLPAAEGNSNITASSFTLSSTTPTRNGYVFTGWCYGTVDHTTSPSTCSGTTYQPGDQFTFTSLSSGPAVANLYAMWKVLEIQNLDPSFCVAGTQTDTTDIRDGNKYTVTRLPDGNCWMTKNLDLAGGTTLTPADSNVSANYTLPASETISSGTTLANSSAFSNDNTAYVFNSSSTTCSSSSPCHSYYSYKAATAGTNPSSGDATSDICPKGWRLPTKAEYTTLVNTYTAGTALTAAPFFGVHAGYYGHGSFYDGGKNGAYWSSTAYDASNAYTLSFAGSGGSPYGNLNRLGNSVRCVRKNLYDTIAEMSKGTQTAADLQTAITVPTSADRTQDTSNSGVYEYNSSVFGTATDAANTYKIYYYRGVLENSVGSYGSDGSAITYPNYVKLGNTCWRILRTTGSGGVKMIYNGTWNTTKSTCASTSTQIGSKGFSIDSAKIYGSAFGYTQNDSYNSSKLSATYSEMFGSNTSFSVNSASSGVKTSVEDWYNNNSNSIKAIYGSHLEADAGYCADRTLNEGTSWTTPMANGTTVGTSTTYYTGAYVRNWSTINPSLTCPRNNADVYTTNTATTGNKQLSAPIALITADEATFAGLGNNKHDNSFLRSGTNFWLLTPASLASGNAKSLNVGPTGAYGQPSKLSLSSGVRPAISLSQGAKISSGNGTATSPWEVTW